MTKPKTKTNTQPINPVFSIRWNKLEDGTFTVEAFVTGLTTEQQAIATVNYMQDLFCADPIAIN